MGDAWCSRRPRTTRVSCTAVCLVGFALPKAYDAHRVQTSSSSVCGRCWPASMHGTPTNTMALDQNLHRAALGALAGMIVGSSAGFGLAPFGGAARAETYTNAVAGSVISDDTVKKATAAAASIKDGQTESYDGFADYAAKGKKMGESDVQCFANQCRQPTVDCFSDGSCLKGVTCLGRCKGEQECATRCFAQYGGPKLDSWLSCTLEDYECVKIPKDLDFSSIEKNPPKIVREFDAKMLEGTWYKVLGVNSKYDAFDCQQNTFNLAQDGKAADLRVEFRLSKPDSGGDFWANKLNERLEVDPVDAPSSFHTQGKMFGLTFKENWYITGMSQEPGQEFVFVQYKGHTLQGSYDGGFVYSRSPTLPPAARPAVDAVAKEHGIAPSALFPIDNTCPVRAALPKSGDTANMNLLQRVQYEAGFLYDLLEWVKPGTIHNYDD